MDSKGPNHELPNPDLFIIDDDLDDLDFGADGDLAHPDTFLDNDTCYAKNGLADPDAFLIDEPVMQPSEETPASPSVSPSDSAANEENDLSLLASVVNSKPMRDATKEDQQTPEDKYQELRRFMATFDAAQYFSQLALCSRVNLTTEYGRSTITEVVIMDTLKIKGSPRCSKHANRRFCTCSRAKNGDNLQQTAMKAFFVKKWERHLLSNEDCFVYKGGQKSARAFASKNGQTPAQFTESFLKDSPSPFDFFDAIESEQYLIDAMVGLWASQVRQYRSSFESKEKAKKGWREELQKVKEEEKAERKARGNSTASAQCQISRSTTENHPEPKFKCVWPESITGLEKNLTGLRVGSLREVKFGKDPDHICTAYILPMYWKEKGLVYVIQRIVLCHSECETDSIALDDKLAERYDEDMKTARSDGIPVCSA